MPRFAWFEVSVAPGPTDRQSDWLGPWMTTGMMVPVVFPAWSTTWTGTWYRPGGRSWAVRLKLPLASNEVTAWSSGPPKPLLAKSKTTLTMLLTEALSLTWPMTVGSLDCWAPLGSLTKLGLRRLTEFRTGDATSVPTISTL